MNKKAIPFAIASSVYEIPFSFYKENGIKHILLDLDNTLACYKDKLPSEKTKKLIQSLKENGYCIKRTEFVLIVLETKDILKYTLK